MKNRFTMRELIKSLDYRENTEWEQQKITLSVNIRDALLDYLSESRDGKEKGFLEYCNCIKSLLAIYNFGTLDEDWDISAFKKVIKDGIVAIIEHVKDDRFDISPMISVEDCQEIFVDQEGKNIPVTLSLATVLTTMIYLRRAMKRNGLFTVEELEDGNPGLYGEVVACVSHILSMLYDYARSNRFPGWGVTIRSTRTTLSDTYAVVDAISRYADAFTQSGTKNDAEFIAAVDAVEAERTKDTKKPIVNLSDCIISARYTVAYSTYARATDEGMNVFGQSIFYADGEKYSPTTMEQISNSNRSSALFNPLYVAMITMIGYNEKEIVIRRFMDDYDLVRKYYDRYEEHADPGSKKISDYATELNWFAPGNYGSDEQSDAAKRSEFWQKAKMLTETHDKKSDMYQSDGEWRRYYEIARVFQKYIENVHPEELPKIKEYRDYLNATKDAIDQVQVMYRKFDDSQRLGIVDTDYIMFNNSDVNTDAINLSKLNKSNIAVNSLRPLLLSAKIMIVNALTKYPQPDMNELYEDIKETKYRRSARRGSGDTGEVWLWNEDKIDMNSTARHIESIAYDFFDYYEKYEIGFKAIRTLKGEIGDIVVNNISKEDGSFDIGVSGKQDATNLIKELILNTTHSNIEIVKGAYQQFLREQQEQFAEELAEKNKRIAQLEQENEATVKEADRKIGELNADTLISLTFKSWIRDEIKSYLKDILSMIVIGTLWGGRDEKSFFFELERNRIPDGCFDGPRSLLKKLKRESEDDRAEACKHYNALRSDADQFKELFDCAFDGNLSDHELLDLVSNTLLKDDSTAPNEKIKALYNDLKNLKDRIRSGEKLNAENKEER